MNQPTERAGGAVRNKTLLIIIVVIAFAVATGVWASALTARPPGPDGGGTVAVATGAATDGSDGPGTAAPARPSAAAVSPQSVPAATVPAATTLPPSQATAKAKADAAAARIPQPTALPLGLTEKSIPEAGVTATVGSIEAVTGDAQGPGQISGPAIRFTLTLANGGSTAIETGKVVVNVEGGTDSSPAIQLSGPGAAPFPESTGAGKTSTGTFVFLIPNDQRDKVRILFNYQVSSPIVAFQGAVPKGA